MIANKTKGIVLAIISSGTFGLIAFFSIPLLRAGLHAPSILFYRSLIAASLLGCICLIRKKKFDISPKVASLLFLQGMLYTFTAMGLIYSYNFISSGIATTIHFLYPVAVACMMIIFYKERLSHTLMLAAVLSLFGVGLLCWDSDGFINSEGLLAALFTVLTYGSYVVNLNRAGIKRLDTEVIMFYVMLFGALIFLAFSSLTTGLEIPPHIDAWGNIIGLAVFATVFSGLALIAAVKNAGSTITSILGSMEPVVATTVGIFYFDETFGWNSFLGLLIIIGAVMMVIVGENKKSSEKVKQNKSV